MRVLRRFSSVVAAAPPAAAVSPLTDTFGRFHNYLRMSITEKCNLRCVYCMPLEGVKLTPSEKLLTLHERTRLISIFHNLGIDKLRFTGGEPTVNKHLVDLIAHARSLEGMRSIGITSNGVMLGAQLKKLTQAGLTHVNISLDTLDPAKFESIVRRDRKLLHRVLSSIYAALAEGLHVKINVVLMRGVNDNEVPAFLQLAKELPLDIRFIEVMPFEDNEWDKTKLITYREILDNIQQQGYARVNRITGGDPHDTTKWFSIDDHAGRLGFITSMSSHFCGGCNRLRITADGKLKACLFNSDETSLVQMLRDGSVSDEDIIAAIASTVQAKKRALGGHKDAEHIASSHSNRPMILIGG